MNIYLSLNGQTSPLELCNTKFQITLISGNYAEI